MGDLGNTAAPADRSNQELLRTEPPANLGKDTLTVKRVQAACGQCGQ